MDFFVNCYLLGPKHRIEKQRHEQKNLPDSILYPFSQTTQIHLHPTSPNKISLSSNKKGDIFKHLQFTENIMNKRFAEIINLIKQSRANAMRTINSELINLYWSIGEYVSKKITKSEWGDSVVSELATYIQHNEPEIKGFSDKNIWRIIF